MTDQPATSAQKRTSDGVPTRDRLIKEAMRLFARRGYDRTTVADIERAAGLSPGSGAMYRHFESKEELLLWGVRKYRKDIQGLWDSLKLKPGRSARTTLQGSAMALAAFASGQGPAIRVFGLQGLMFPKEAKKEIAGAWNDGYAIFAKSLRSLATDEVLARHDVDALAIQMLSSLSYYFIQVWAFGEERLPVPALQYVKAWVDTWSSVLDPKSPGRSKP